MSWDPISAARRSASGYSRATEGTDDHPVKCHLHLLGDRVVGHRRPQQEDEHVLAGVALPPRHEMADEDLAAPARRGRGQIGRIEIDGRRGGEQPRLGPEVAHHHRGVDARLGGDGADRGLLIAARGEGGRATSRMVRRVPSERGPPTPGASGRAAAELELGAGRGIRAASYLRQLVFANAR